jgi:hypothetical protein
LEVFGLNVDRIITGNEITKLATVLKKLPGVSVRFIFLRGGALAPLFGCGSSAGATPLLPVM